MTTTKILVLCLGLLPIALINAECSSISGICNKDNILLQDCDISDFSENEVAEACDDAALAFGDVSLKEYQHDKNFMDGGSSFNNYNEDEKSAYLDAGRLLRFRDRALGNTRVLWPKYEALNDYANLESPQDPYMDNFNMTDACELRTAMCCFTQSRTDSIEFVPNSEVCFHNMEDSAHSNHVKHGYGVGNTDTYCVGFSWDSDETSDSYRYKGNLLAEISYGIYLDEGYTKNIPLGAPMCGCIEKMPTVTNAACHELVVHSEKYSVSIVEGELGTVLSIEQTDAIIDFAPCENDLLAHYSGSEEEYRALEKKLPGSCDRDAYLSEKFFIPGSDSVFDEPDSNQWIKVAGQGIDYVPHKYSSVDDRDVDFRSMFLASPNGIVYRKCSSCTLTHQHIYYRRWTELPEDLNFIDLFLNNWVSTGNELGVDFDLYSTYDEAVTGTDTGKWEYCDFGGYIGFPHQCGPTGEVTNNWNSHERSPSGTDLNGGSHAFYLEIAGSS